MIFDKSKIFQFTGARGNGKKTYIIPTTTGIFAIALTFYTLVAGMVYSNNLVMILGILLLISTAFCSIMTNFYLHEVTFSNIHFLDSHSHQELVCEIKCKTKVDFENIILKVYTDRGAFNLKFNQRNDQLLTYHTNQPIPRGHYKIKFIQYSTTFPLSLFFSWKSQKPLQQSFYRYPKINNFQKFEFAKPLSLDQSKYEKGIDEYQQHSKGNPRFLVGKVDWKRYFGKQEVWLKNFEKQNMDLFQFDLKLLAKSEGKSDQKDRKEKIEKDLSQIATEMKYLTQTGSNWELQTHQKVLQNQSISELYKESMQELASYES